MRKSKTKENVKVGYRSKKKTTKRTPHTKKLNLHTHKKERDTEIEIDR
jgi:hypothetical protein